MLVSLAIAPAVHASIPHPFVLLVTQAPDRATTLVTWAPVTGAMQYVVLRGPSLNTLVPVQAGPETFFLDGSGAGMLYVVHAASQRSSSQSGPSGGDCVASGPGSVTVNTESCVHGRS